MSLSREKTLMEARKTREHALWHIIAFLDAPGLRHGEGAGRIRHPAHLPQHPCNVSRSPRCLTSI